MTIILSQRRRFHPTRKQQSIPPSRFKCRHPFHAYRKPVHHSSGPYHLLRKKQAFKHQRLFTGLKLEFRGCASGQLWSARFRLLCDCNAGIPPRQGACFFRARRWNLRDEGGRMAWMSWVKWPRVRALGSTQYGLDAFSPLFLERTRFSYQPSRHESPRFLQKAFSPSLPFCLCSSFHMACSPPDVCICICVCILSCAPFHSPDGSAELSRFYLL